MIYTGLSHLALAGGFSKTEAATPHMKQQKGRIQRVLTLHVHHHYKQTGMLASLTFCLCIQQRPCARAAMIRETLVPNSWTRVDSRPTCELAELQSRDSLKAQWIALN